MASVLIPSDGMAQEWSTSSEEMSIRIGSSMGRTTRLSTSSSRRPPDARSVVGIMYESNVRSS